MSNKDNNSIGLADFIQQVKQDLLSVAPGKENDAPFLFVESVELELQVTVKQTGKAGAKGSIEINVLGIGGEIGGELGGELSRDKVHKVTVKLSPLVSKEYLLKAYYKKNPEKWQEFVDINISGTLKGSDDPGI